MKPVLKQEEALIYVSESSIVRFVSENAPMEWNVACDFIRKEGLTSDSGEPCSWRRKEMCNPKNKKHYNEQVFYWIGAFFDAHPWIENMMVVFDD